MSTVTERLAAALADRYRIDRELGAGGMATVYLAHDLRHDRKVAVKVLKPELAAVLGADRFVVEIKTTASMSHPHILPLFDSGTSDGFLFYVMPFVEGETLRDTLNRETQLAIDDAVRIAREVLDALHYAHTHGVIHRDIKPENILMQGGRPMVADFGIALAVSAAAGGRMTETGLSLGTPHYMSPEQATAEKEITGRADIYSLASVLYEMLTGEPPHMGNSAQQIIMKIITEPAAAVTKFRKAVPPHVAAAVAKALEKLPADRFQTAKAFADALGDPGFTAPGLTAATDAASSAAVPSRRGSRRALIGAWAVAMLAVVGAVAGWLRSVPEPPFRRLDLTFGEVAPEFNSDVAISPDGSVLAMSARVGNEQAIYVRNLDGDAAFRKLAGTEFGFNPSFSPDGKWIVFARRSDRALMKIAIAGGGAITLVPAGQTNPFAPQWGDNDTIIFTTPSSLHRVPAAGGAHTQVPGILSGAVSILPGSRAFLKSESGNLLLYDVVAETSTVILNGGRSPVYVPSGHILYAATDGGLFAVKFDADARRVIGDPVRLVERVGSTTTSRGYAASREGTLVVRDAESGGVDGINTIVIFDPGRQPDTLRLPPARRLAARFSRNGRALSLEVINASRSGASDIFTVDLVTGTYAQLTFEGDNDAPAWSPDGTRLLFDTRVNSGQEDLAVKPADGSAPERRLFNGLLSEMSSPDWFADTAIVFHADVAGRGTDIFVSRPDSGYAPVPYLRSPSNESQPRVSPDGKLLAFVSDELGSSQIWMRDFPVPQGKWNLSGGSAAGPRWSPDGRYVYFWRPGPLDSLFRVRIERSPSIVVRSPEFVYAVDVDGIVNWDLHPDGRRFVVPLPLSSTGNTGGAAPARYLILQNFVSELERLGGGRR